jgi:hypothetical protein
MDAEPTPLSVVRLICFRSALAMTASSRIMPPRRLPENHALF